MVSPSAEDPGSVTTLNIPENGLYTISQSTDYIVSNDSTKASEKDSLNRCTLSWTRRLCRKKTLERRLPIVAWLPRYTLEDGIGDVLAGITVGMTVIPLGLAFANIAGLDLQYGLYSCFMGSLVYIFFGSHRDVCVGPTALASFLVYQACQGQWQRAVLLTFLTGLIEIAMGFLRLGFLIDFVSGPVSAGFTSATALIIFTSQLNPMLGVNTKGDTFIKMWTSVLGDIDSISWYDAALGASCVVVLLLMRCLMNLRFADDHSTTVKRVLNKVLWFLGTSRNAVLVCLTSIMGYHLIQSGQNVFRMVGYVPQGLPTPKLPPFSVESLESVNGTIPNGGSPENFLDLVGDFGSSLIVIPLIALLENMAVVQAFANGKPCDATQELFAVGLCNVATALMQGFRGNGGLARGSVLHSSGNRTQLSNLYSALMVIVALLYFTPAFFYIPRATLAGIIVAAVIFLVQYRVVKPMWRSKKKDLIPGVAAFVACLILPLQIGILVGIALNMAFILYHAARPKLRVETCLTRAGVKYLMVSPDRLLIFPSAEFIRNAINKHGLRHSSNTPVVIDCTYIYSADFTAAKAVAGISGDFRTRQQPLYFHNLQPKILQVFEACIEDLRIVYDLQAFEAELDGRTAAESSKL